MLLLLGMIAFVVGVGMIWCIAYAVCAAGIELIFTGLMMAVLANQERRDNL